MKGNKLLDWDRLTDKDFEELCFVFLSKTGFENIEWFGQAGNDRGRDIKCTKTQIILENFTKVIQYLVQCKKWVSRPPEPEDLNDTIAWADAHNPDVLVIMVSNTLTGNTKDWIKLIQKKKAYSIILYEEINFKGFFDNHQDIYAKFFETKQSRVDEDYLADIQQRILLVLAKNGSLTANGVSEEASISISKVKLNLKSLVSSKLVVLTNKKYSLVNSQESFLGIAEKLLDSKSRFEFVGTPYADSFFNKELIDYIESRYYIKLTSEERDRVLLLIRLGPRALQHALFGSTETFKNGFKYLKILKLNETEQEKWAASFTKQLLMDISGKFVLDLGDKGSTNLFVKNKIEGYFLKIELKMANQTQQVLNMVSGAGVMLQKAVGKIEAGQFLSVTDPDLYIKIADVLSNLDLNEQAIENYDIAIDQVKDNEKLKAAYNNKGVTLKKMGKYKDAINCFDEALKIDPSLGVAIRNREDCIGLLKD